MSSRIIKIIVLFLVILLGTLGIIIGLSNPSHKDDTLLVVATNFPAYDFARAVVGDAGEVKMLLDPGAEPHDYEPTPKDIIDIKSSQLFIYTGGESDEWVENVLRDTDSGRTKTFRMMDAVRVVTEEVKEGMDDASEEDEKEYDEHVWTSLRNAEKIINAIKDELIKISPEYAETFSANAKSYTEKLATLDEKFQEIVKNGTKKPLIFGDRFPLRYFVDDYGLDYYAAFPGCSDETEASSNTIAFLINKVKSDHIPVIFKTELSSDEIATTIARETGAKISEFNSAHRISAADFNSGLTYLDLMTRNLAPLKEALK